MARKAISNKVAASAVANVMGESAARAAAAEVANNVTNALRAKFKKEVAQDVAKFTSAKAAEHAASVVQADVFLHCASLGVNHRKVADDKGMIPELWAVLEEFEAQFMSKRDEKKASDYTRRVKSNLRSVMVACQLPKATITQETTDENGKIKTIKREIKPQEWLADKAVCPGIDDLIKWAGVIKREAGYVSNNATKTKSNVSATTLNNVFDTRLKGRMDAAGIIKLQTLLGREARKATIKENHAYFDTQFQAWLGALTKALSESAADVQPPNTKSNAAARAAVNQAKGIPAAPDKRDTTGKANVKRKAA
jgi:hypothetical protein